MTFIILILFLLFKPVRESKSDGCFRPYHMAQCTPDERKNLWAEYVPGGSGSMLLEPSYFLLSWMNRKGKRKSLPQTKPIMRNIMWDVKGIFGSLFIIIRQVFLGLAVSNKNLWIWYLWQPAFSPYHVSRQILSTVNPISLATWKSSYSLLYVSDGS